MVVLIDANVPLDCIEFDIFPSENRYGACACYANKRENVTSGLLEHLLVHSSEVKALHSKGSNTKYKLKAPEDHGITWFTKSTLIRFLHMIGATNMLGITNSVKNEISQLEEARKFHLSLYAKDTVYQLQTLESGNSNSDRNGSTQGEGSDASKNELLRAMDLRLAALREELTAAFDQATGCRYSVEEMSDIEKFSDHFGSADLRDSLCKYIELRQGNQAVDHRSGKQIEENDRVKQKEGYNHTAKSASSETPIIYGVSPAKLAQIERQSSTESEESSFSSEEEQPSADRSRTLIRSASPRRSASPMRRVQIGRSGFRRSTAITIKSLNSFPARERSLLPKDPAADDSGEEGSEQAPRKSETNVRRMSVQDAINLFESKQKDKTVDIQKATSLLNASMAAKKSVLRRWSSGMGEDSSRCPQDPISEDAVPQTQNNLESRKIANCSAEAEAEPVVASVDYPTDHCGLDAKLNSPEKIECTPEAMQKEALPIESTNANEKLTASAKWSYQKEAELNELLMKMMETKPAKSRTGIPASSKRQTLPTKQRSGFYDQYKGKRDEKLRGEIARNAEKDKQLRATHQILDARKSQLSSANASDDGRKNKLYKLQKSQKNASQPANPKTERPKLNNVKKVSPKVSSFPALRKSWPSMPSPRTTGESPAKTSIMESIDTNPTRRRSQPGPSVSRSRPKVETSQLRAKSVKLNPNDSKRSPRKSTEKKQQSLTKPSKRKSKIQTGPEDLVSSAKPSLYSKVTKKGSVVPLEMKPFLRKGSGTISHLNPVVKTKAPSNLQEPLWSSEVRTLAEENEAVSISSDPVIMPQERELGEVKIHIGGDSGSSAGSPEKCEDKEGFIHVNPIIDENPTTDDGTCEVVEPELKAEAEEEPTISPTAWVQIEEHEDQPLSSSVGQMESPTYEAPVGVSNARVRHSLSQMLLEESSEHDIIDWGNAENPPPMVYQKDAPKGLKRLLKFARKMKTDANANPSVFSEGEDDAADSKFASKRNPENLLKKATLHSTNNRHQKATYGTYQKNSADYEHPAQAHISTFIVQSSSDQQSHEGCISASATTKATRSFFSLSAFKGSR